ncbi:MAG TPA: CHAP domain-containing protein [Streptosporangiaceae bacterium]|nr:CHAP domain-containing protein [Streptosporangiaceae bacterium]
MSDARDNGKGALPSGPGQPSRPPLVAWLIPVILAIASGTPALAASTATAATAASEASASAAARSPSVVVCAGYASCDSRGYTSHGYAAHSGRSYWRMIAGNECTNYVAYVESAVLRAPAPPYLLGNAGQWPATAAAHGVVVNHVPSAGAVAEWDGGAPGMGSAGHIAVVEKVGPRDRYIVISQQHIGSDPDGYDWTRINAGFPAADWQEWPDHFIHFQRSGARTGATVGYYNPRSGSYHLQAAPGATSAAIRFRRGGPGAIPLVGDWAGRGADGTGYYNPRTGWFHLRNQLSAGPSSRAFAFGPPGMVPLAGNWDGRGGAGIGYYDPATGTFHLRNYLSSGPAQDTFRFGPPGMVPLAGDWAGSGRAGIGYYNPATGRFHLRSQLSAGPARYVFKFGPPGMRPLVGRWTGGRADEVGFYNPGTGWFHLRDHLSAGPASEEFRFGPRNMVPLAGDWPAAEGQTRRGSGRYGLMPK